MINNSWKFILTSIAGTSHVATDTPCQDSSACEVLDDTNGSSVLIAVVADGAGSAKCAEAGAALACSYFVSRIRRHLQSKAPLGDIDHELVRNWIADFQAEVITQCGSGDLVPRDFASTLLAAAIGNDEGLFFQIGDGAIVIADSEEPENYRWVFWPQQGQYANETNFATEDNATEKIEFNIVNRRIDELTLFTDGLQGLTLDYQSRQAHAPFFTPIFEWLRSAPELNSKTYTDSLNAFLNTERINDRTDDDKTIVIATRRTSATHQNSAQPDHDDQQQIASL
jgi:hypothetical protein